jgi:hypothetical protein
LAFACLGKFDDARRDDFLDDGWFSRLCSRRAGAVIGITHDGNGLRPECRVSDERMYRC